jgi:NAD-dependent SIR2 family protein deacetylase
MEEFTCTKCGESKPFADFPLDRSHSRGFASRCKKCHAKEQRRRPVRPGEYQRDQAHKIGITVERYVEISAQKCYVCGTASADESQANGPYLRRADGAVLGTICRKCATALGFLGHDPERVQRALSLITGHPIT